MGSWCSGWGGDVAGYRKLCRMSDQATTFIRNLAGRDIVFRYPLAAQLIILRRKLLIMGQQAEQTEDQTELAQLSSNLISYTLDVVESLIVNPEDVQFLENAMLTGKVDHTEVMDVLSAKREDEKPVRKRTAAKTVTKAAANRGRTKR